MSNYQFSATTTSFYPTDMLDAYKQAGTLPDDLVEVTDEIYTTFISQPPEGKTRGCGQNGQPAWTDIPLPTPEQQQQSADAQKQQLMTQALVAILPLQNAVKLKMATNDEKTLLTAWEKYSVLLNRVDTGNPVWPETPV